MSAPEEAASAMKALVTDKKQQMLISTALRAYLADILLIQLDNPDDESTEDAKNMIKVLEKGKCGRPDAMKLLIKFLETSDPDQFVISCFPVRLACKSSRNFRRSERQGRHTDCHILS